MPLRKATPQRKRTEAHQKSDNPEMVHKLNAWLEKHPLPKNLPQTGSIPANPVTS